MIYRKSLWLMILSLFLLIGCKKDEYSYPSVKMDFLSVLLDENGAISKVITDDAKSYTNIEWEKESSFLPKMKKALLNRMIANYEVLSKEKGGSVLKIYGATLIPLNIPQLAKDNSFPQDGVELASIWKGVGFVNLSLNVLCDNFKVHQFKFIQEKVSEDGASKEVYIRLLHDSHQDPQYYYQKVYMSIPIYQYAQDVDRLTVHFSFKDYKGKDNTYELSYIKEK